MYTIEKLRLYRLSLLEKASNETIQRLDLSIKRLEEELENMRHKFQFSDSSSSDDDSSS